MCLDFYCQSFANVVVSSGRFRDFHVGFVTLKYKDGSGAIFRVYAYGSLVFPK